METILWMFVTPIIYIYFNRPEITRRTFAIIRELRPRRLYLIADGPRAAKITDAARCRETRAVVEGMLDWTCEVTRDYSDVNLGAGKRIASGLTSAFAQLGEGIVLEDDILPHPDFFTFCAAMLVRYRDNPRVHGISGFNPVGRFLPHEQSVVPTLTHITWGWASWHRAWKDYRGAMQGWEEPAIRASVRNYIQNDLYFGAIEGGLKAVADRAVDAWDYQWVYTMLYERRLALVSATNLIFNLGFMRDATHTFDPPTYITGLGAYAIPDSPAPTNVESPDRLFDRVAWQILLDGSRTKIALLRGLARRSRWLTSKALPVPAN